jgi:hypothetical protein
VDGSLPIPKLNYKGIDCSGFVYIVFEHLYKTVFNKNINDILSVPKQDVLNGALHYQEWRDAYLLSHDESNNLPDDVPLTWVIDTFKRKPINLCRVAGLVSNYSSTAINLSDVQIGDCIYMTNIDDHIAHIAIITHVQESSLTIVHSGRDNSSDIGGIITETIPTHGDMIDCLQMKSPRNFISIRRLKR